MHEVNFTLAQAKTIPMGHGPVVVIPEDRAVYPAEVTLSGKACLARARRSMTGAEGQPVYALCRWRDSNGEPCTAHLPEGGSGDPMGRFWAEEPGLIQFEQAASTAAPAPAANPAPSQPTPEPSLEGQEAPEDPEIVDTTPETNTPADAGPAS